MQIPQRTGRPERFRQSLRLFLRRAAPEAEEAEAELDGEDIYMEEEESGGWIEEAEE